MRVNGVLGRRRALDLLAEGHSGGLFWKNSPVKTGPRRPPALHSLQAAAKPLYVSM